MVEYARPEMLVNSEWLAQHLHNPGLRLIEVDVDTSMTSPLLPLPIAATTFTNKFAENFSSAIMRVFRSATSRPRP
jgi:hypothetical protein